MKFAWIVAALLLCPAVAGAAKRSEILKQVESSMLVTGTIETRADGTVSSTTIDKPEKLPGGVVDFVQKQVATWKFEPVVIDGKARPTRSPMSVRLVAKRLDDKNYSIGIRNANFEGTAPREGETLTGMKLTPPSYPQSVAMSGASGVVYVVVKVGKDGHVADAIIEQVNLKTVGLESEMAAWRKSLSNAALQATRKWTFATPTKGELADDEFWSARVPVAFHMDKRFDAAYGKWELYIPGVRQTIPWSDEDRPGFSPDGLADGGVYMLGKNDGPKLLTPLDGT
ncbi:protein tonB [Pseudoxanthomonas sacheonensis]|uniref:protein tonB n=1 Tax=Pseudoxanthomonas sacheonensis TaxID=443615 RepID=UPI001FE465D4|nr:protein tonB [Pseudoxanthomonas sacheonensis]